MTSSSLYDAGQKHLAICNRIKKYNL